MKKSLFIEEKTYASSHWANPNVYLIKILIFSILIFLCYANCIHFVYIACIIN